MKSEEMMKANCREQHVGITTDTTTTIMGICTGRRHMLEPLAAYHFQGKLLRVCHAKDVLQQRRMDLLADKDVNACG